MRTIVGDKYHGAQVKIPVTVAFPFWNGAAGADSRALSRDDRSAFSVEHGHLRRLEARRIADHVDAPDPVAGEGEAQTGNRLNVATRQVAGEWIKSKKWIEEHALAG